MFHLSVCRRLGSRHLVIIPKIEPTRTIKYTAPRTLTEFRKELKRLLNIHDQTSVPPEFLKACVELVPMSYPSDILRLMRLMGRGHLVSSDVKKVIINRIAEISTNVPLHALIAVYQKYPSVKLLDILKVKKIEQSELASLGTDRLISLVKLLLNKPVVIAELTSESRLANMTEYQLATLMNVLKQRYLETGLWHTTPAVIVLLEALSKELLTRIGKLNMTTKQAGSKQFSFRDIALIFNAVGSFAAVPSLSAIRHTLGSTALCEYAISVNSTSVEERFDTVQVPMIMHALSKLSSVSFISPSIAQLLDLLCLQVAETITSYRSCPKGIGMIMYSVGKLDADTVSVSGLSRAVAELIKRDIAVYDMHSLAMCCYGFSKLNMANDELIEVISKELVHRASGKRSFAKKYAMTDLGMIAKFLKNSSANANLSNNLVTDAVFKMIKTQLKYGASDENSIKAKKTSSIDPVSVIHLVDLLSRVSAAKGSACVKGQLYWISKLLFPVIPNLTTDQTMQLLHKLVSIKMSHKPLIESMIDSLSLETIRSDQVPHVFNILGKITRELGSETTKKLTTSKQIPKLCHIAGVHMPEYLVSVTGLSMILYGLSELLYRDEKLIAKIERCLVNIFRGRKDSLETVLSSDQMTKKPEIPHVLSKLFISLSRLRSTNDELYGLLWKSVFEHIHLFQSNDRAICNILFASCSAIGARDILDNTSVSGEASGQEWYSTASKYLLKTLVASYRHKSFLSVESIRQLQVFHAWERFGSDGRRITDDDNGAVAEFMRKVNSINTYETRAPSIEQSSVSHREISKYLTILGHAHKNETVLGPFTIDVYFPNSRHIVEIDGPHHFFHGTNTRTSSSILKHNLLSGMGYKDTHVPYHEWIQCTSDAKKMAYCDALINTNETS